uniref:Uncharacterized protein n=1 Tax=Candidatus Kentrum sp. LFY TaxID=2126342 RepID=A0A450WIG2_9GAMM|nr:MAG: hypothetical protein BECKLFY1418C_GA0070996_102615 [Candidatus Kentron sp. LFY]
MLASIAKFGSSNFLITLFRISRATHLARRGRKQNFGIPAYLLPSLAKLVPGTPCRDDKGGGWKGWRSLCSNRARHDLPLGKQNRYFVKLDSFSEAEREINKLVAENHSAGRHSSRHSGEDAEIQHHGW